MMKMEKTRIKLEVGKSYKDSTGMIVRIIQVRDMDERPYLGDDNCDYHEDGAFMCFEIKSDEDIDMESEFDLIEEVADIKIITTDDTTTTTTDPKGVYEVKYIAIKNSEVSKLEDLLREHICGLVTMGKYQDAKELLNILIEEGKNKKI